MKIDFNALMEPVAERILGAPNSKLSTRGELRWGSRGSLSVDRAKGVWYDHEAGVGGGVIDLIKREGRCSSSAEAYQWLVKNRFITSAQADSREANIKKMLKAEAEEEGKQESFYTALSLLRAAAKATTDAPADYLASRGITNAPQCAMLVTNTAKVNRLTGKRFPALVVPILKDPDHLQGAQITWLSADCQAKLAVSDGSARRTYGELNGGFVPLGQPDPNKPLIVAEGIETTLSAMQITDCPGIAVLSAGNMAKLPMTAVQQWLRSDHRRRQ